ncbi:ATP synthase F1 subunit delta [Desulfohalobium retbaense]|nr:ATP synthase F1 subunit delta [Desulfohalobium retbaense]
MTGQMIASRYARALFQLCKEQGGNELESTAQQLNALATVMEQSPELYRLFRNPAFSAQEKKNVIEAVLAKGEYAAVVINFCRLLADKGRLAILPDVDAVFQVLLDQEKGVMRGEVVTAVSMPKTDREKIKSQLEGQLGQELVLDFRVNKKILGGLVLKVGDKLYDASLRAQLDMLKENLKRGE